MAVHRFAVILLVLLLSSYLYYCCYFSCTIAVLPLEIKLIWDPRLSHPKIGTWKNIVGEVKVTMCDIDHITQQVPIGP